MADVRHLDIAEFCRLGFLQEVNRLVLHPCGLALEVTVDKCKACSGSGFMEDGPAGATYSAPCTYCTDGKVERLSGVWDYRADPEGVIFGADVADKVEKAASVQAERRKHAAARARLFGIIKDGPVTDMQARLLATHNADIEPLGWEHDAPEE